MRDDGSTASAASDREPVRGPRLPPEPWTLTAPESFSLRYGAMTGSGAELFRIALKDLIWRRALVLEGTRVPRRWAPGTCAVWQFADGPRRSAVNEPTLVPVLELVDRVREQRPRATGGVLLTDLVKAGTRRRFEGDLKDHVTRSLRRQRLVSRTGQRTPAGEHADEELDHWLEIGRRQFANWSHHQPWRRAYLSGAGASILLITDSALVLDRIGSPKLVAEDPSDSYAVAADQLTRAVHVLDAGFVRVAADGDGGGGGDGGG